MQRAPRRITGVYDEGVGVGIHVGVRRVLRGAGGVDDAGHEEDGTVRTLETLWYPDAMPDRSIRTPLTLFKAAPWTYAQSFQPMLLPNGDVIVTLNGAAPGIFEADWALLCPADGSPPTYHHLWSGDEVEGEVGLFSLVHTGWGGARDWLLAWSGAWQRDWGLAKAYRVWVGLAVAPDWRGPWARKQEGIFSTKRVPQQPPPSAWWPNGTWQVATLNLAGRVLVIVRDNSADPAQRVVHLVYEVKPDLTVREVGSVTCSDEGPQTWLTDAKVGADGKLYVLDGRDPGQAGTNKVVREYASGTAWSPDAVTTLKPTGRTWSHSTLPTTWDAGYLGDQHGLLTEPRLVICNVGQDGNWKVRGNWRAWVSDEGGAYADRLAVTPLPVLIGMPGLTDGLEVVWLGPESGFPLGGGLTVWPSAQSDGKRSPCFVNFGVGDKASWVPLESCPGPVITFYERVGKSVLVPAGAPVVAVRGDCYMEFRGWPRFVQRVGASGYVQWGG